MEIRTALHRRRRALLWAAGGLMLGAASPLPRAQPQPKDSLPTLKLPLPAPAEAAATASDGVPGGSVHFIGTATVVLRLGPFTLLTDPNFLHQGELAHLGYGIKSPRLADPALGLDRLPPLDAVLLSHFHGDHFDEVAERGLDKLLPVIATPHAVRQLAQRGFRSLHGLAA